MKKINIDLSTTKNKMEFIINFLFLLFTFSIPSFSYNFLHVVPIIIATILMLIILFYVIKYSTIVIDFVTSTFLLYLILIVASFLINGFNKFPQTPLLLGFLFLAIYQYAKTSKNEKTLMCLFFVGVSLFAVFFTIYYRDPIFSFDFSYRLGGFFGNQNQIGDFFTLGYVFSLYLVFFNKKIYYSIPLLCFAFLGLFTGSKTVLLLLALSTFLAILLFFGKKRWYLSFISILAALLLFIVVLSLPQLAPFARRMKDFMDFLLGSGNSVDRSSILRSHMIDEAIYLFLRSPLLGNGFASFSELSGSGTYSHNTIVELLSNFGIFTFITFEVILIYPIYSYLKSGNKDKIETYIFIQTAMIVISQISSMLYTAKEFYVLISLFAVYFSNKNNSEVFIRVNIKNIFLNQSTVESQIKLFLKNKGETKVVIGGIDYIEKVKHITPSTIFIDISSSSNQSSDNYHSIINSPKCPTHIFINTTGLNFDKLGYFVRMIELSRPQTSILIISPQEFDIKLLGSIRKIHTSIKKQDNLDKSISIGRKGVLVIENWNKVTSLISKLVYIEKVQIQKNKTMEK